MFYPEYVRLCEKNGTTPTGAAKAMGLAGAHVNKWKNGSLPTDLTLLKICKYFDLPEGYFNALDKKETSPTSEEAELVAKMTIQLKKLTPEEMQKVLAFVQGILAAR